MHIAIPQTALGNRDTYMHPRIKEFNYRLSGNSFQVETIGDCYMVAAGLPGTAENHAEAVAEMAFDMREIGQSVKTPSKFTMGLQVGNATCL